MGTNRVNQLFGKYRLTRYLGAGGFAEVYLGEHRFLKTYAALKILYVTLTREMENNFLAEARTLAQLVHPNIVRVLDFDMQQGTPFLVMEYVAGGTLRKQVQRGSRLPLPIVVDYVNQVAAALQFAHNHNVIHRDVKPDNMLLANPEHILLSDFGLALFSPSPDKVKTQPELVEGTFAYAAPEQLRGKPTYASDQYALAVATYEWLCGTRPFEGGNIQLLYKQTYEEPPPLRNHRPGLPSAVEDVVLRALAKDPRQRFPSVHAFALALEHASQGALVQESDEEMTQPLRVPASTPSPTLERAAVSPRPSNHVFLSYQADDATFANRLKFDLSKRGVIFTNDFTLGHDLARNEQAVRQQIRAAQVILVVASPSTRSSRSVKEQIRIAVTYQKHLVFVSRSPNGIDPLLFSLWEHTSEVIEASPSRYAKALDEIIESLNEDTLSSPLLAIVPEEIPTFKEPRNPYKGLHAFKISDASDFFGRDKLIGELVKKVQTLVTKRTGVPSSRLLTLIGPSGSGKSSVLMAGLLPRLQKGKQSGSNQWLYLDPITPGDHPRKALINTIRRKLPHVSERSIQADLEDESMRGLHKFAMTLAPKDGRVVLVIDQFEEIFSRAVSEYERQQVLDLLITAISEPTGPLLVLLTLRADFYGQTMNYPELSSLIEANHVPVLPMDLHDLRDVIEKPAALPDVQVFFEGNLVGDLLFEAQAGAGGAGQVGVLPLLEFTLDELFQRREGNWLTLGAYNQFGGLKGALVHQAEETYNHLLGEEYRVLTRILFLRLIDPGPTSQDATRRRASLSELNLPDHRQTAMMRQIAEAFVAARLLITNDYHGDLTIELSHEALITHWSRLRNWLRSSHADVILQRGISSAASEWQRHNQQVGHLYRGSKLIEAQAWAKRNIPTRDENEFLEASAREQQREEEEKLQSLEAQVNAKEREIVLQKSITTRQRILLAALSIFTIIAIVLSSLTTIYYLTAQEQTRQNIANKLIDGANLALSQNNLDLALLLSVKATQAEETAEARNGLLHTLEASPHILTMLHEPVSTGPVRTLAFTRDGQTLFSATNKRAYTWDLHSRNWQSLQLAPVPEGRSIGSVALSPDDHTIGFVNNAGIWLHSGNVDTRLDTQTPLDQNLITMTTIGFDGAGMHLAATRCIHYINPQSLSRICDLTAIGIWDLSSKPFAKIHCELNTDVITSALSPNGELLATAGPTGISIWNVADCSPFISLLDHSKDTITIAFNSDGTLLAGSNTDHTIRLWDLPSGQSAIQLVGASGTSGALAFRPHSTQLVSGGEDMTLRIWDTRTGQQIGAPLTGHKNAVTSLAFSTDGSTLASGSSDQTIILWNIDAQSPIARRLFDITGLSSPIFSNNNKFIFTGTSEGQVHQLDAHTGKQLLLLDTTAGYPSSSPQDAAIQKIAITSDGTHLATGRVDGTILIWNIAEHRVIAAFKHPGHLESLALSADGHLLAAAGSTGADNTVLVWDVSKQTVLYTFAVKQYNTWPLSLTMTGDGHQLAAASCREEINTSDCKQPQVLLWDLTSKASIPTATILLGNASPIKDTVFSPDGQLLATSDGSQIIIWNTTTHTISDSFSIPPPSGSRLDYTSRLVFSPNSKLLASFSSPLFTPFTFVLWDVPGHQLYAHPFSADHASQGSIVFSADSQQILSLLAPFPPPDSPDAGFALLWNIDVSLWQKQACSIANRDFSVSERKLYVKSEDQKNPC